MTSACQSVSVAVQLDSETAVISDDRKPVARKRCSSASSFIYTVHHALCIALLLMYASAPFAFSPTSIKIFRVTTTNLYAVPQGGNMAYIQPNIDRQMKTYSQIRQVGGLECVSDVYARNPKQSQFWFIGKVARCTGTVSLNEAIARQINLIEEHAVRLRPVELGRSFGSLEIWVAPGDSEMACSENTIPLERMQRYAEVTEDVSLKEVGFSCQVVTNQGAGFAIERCNDGTVRGELHPSAEDENTNEE